MAGSTGGIAAVAFALAAAGCAPGEPDPARPSILVIAVDGLRHDHLGASGYDRATSPAIDALAAEGVRFENAFAAAPWQVPAHMALISGADPRIARRILPPDVVVRQASLWHLPDEAPHPAAQFLTHGMATALFYDHDNLSPVYGYQAGFELYQGPTRDDDAPRADTGSPAVFRRFTQWLGALPRAQAFFAYLEVADLERVWNEVDPKWDSRFPPRAELNTVPPVGEAQRIFFAVPSTRWTEGIATLGEHEARYDGGIAQLDNALREMLGRLQRLGRLEDTTIVFVGAYGMSFGESGLFLDSGTFDDADLHVPLIVRPARAHKFRAGHVSDALVSTLDLMPTLLELVGVPAPAGLHGVSFRAALDGAPSSSARFVHASCGFQEGYAVIDERYCFERTWPGRVSEVALSASWFGDFDRHPDVVREVLHDRRSAPRAHHLEPFDADVDVLRRLSDVAAGWSARVEALRASLQDDIGLPAATTPASGGR